MEPTLVIFSGGQDSTTCLLQSIAERGAANVHSVTFAYGQRHKLEVELAEGLAKELGVASHKTIAVDWYKNITHSALIGKDGPVGDNALVDGRNTLFLLYAAIYAKGLGIHDLTIGVSEADYSDYPDCREAFVKSMEQTIRLAMDWPFRILAPLQHLTKEQEWALADKLGRLDFVRTRTLTCYEGIPGDGCGKCPACRLRAAGLDAYLCKKQTPGMGPFGEANA